MLRDFVTFNKLKIPNGFLRKKKMYTNISFQRGSKSIIHYIMTNKKITGHVRDTIVYRGVDTRSDHYLVVPVKAYSHLLYNIHLQELGNTK